MISLEKNKLGCGCEHGGTLGHGGIGLKSNLLNFRGHFINIVQLLKILIGCQGNGCTWVV